MTKRLSDRIRVVSKRRGGVEALFDERIVDVDRANPTFGNPYILHDHNNLDERRQVIADYERLLAKDIAEKGSRYRAIQGLARDLASGQRLALRCWCAPRPCHGDRIRLEIIAAAEALDG